jgi:hypothetical protein
MRYGMSKNSGSTDFTGKNFHHQGYKGTQRKELEKDSQQRLKRFGLKFRKNTLP